jgi:hypothetical protein
VHIIPAGTYFIGDPGQVISENDWWDFLEQWIDASIATFDFRGRRCFTARTAYGDGIYQDQNGNQYMVDAGVIGATPVELIEPAMFAEAVEESLGCVVTLSVETACEVIEERYTIRIGDIRIPTCEDGEDGRDEDSDWKEIQATYGK